MRSSDQREFPWPPFGDFPGICNWKETLGQTRSILEELYIPSGLGRPWDPPGRAGEQEEAEPESEALNLMIDIQPSVVVMHNRRRDFWLAVFGLYGYELWVMTLRMKLWIKVVDISFLGSTSGLSLRDRMRRSDTRLQLGEESLLLCIEI